jgi:glycosyltransferase involved in cell wall biosynthesis
LERLAIGIAYPGDPRDPAEWSGTPAGIVGGLEELGIRVVTVRAEPGRRATRLARAAVAAPHLHAWVRGPRRAWRSAAATPAYAAVRTHAARHSLRRAGDLDGLIQIGTGFLLPPGSPVVTFEDMTVPQARRAAWGELADLADRAVTRRIAMQRIAHTRATACCASTAWAAASLINELGVPASKVHVAGLGRNHVAPSGDRDWSVPRFMFVGWEWERKNGAAVLRAFAALRERRPDVRLDLIGGHPPCAQDGVTGHGPLRLSVADERRRLEELFSRATCFVMPSRFEPAGIVYVEAGAAGIPSIAGMAGGAADMVGPGGLVVDPEDDHGLVQAMERLCDPVVAAALGARAAEHASRFTWRAVAERLVRALAPEGVALDGLAEPL